MFFGFRGVHGGHPVAGAGEVLSRMIQLARALPVEVQGMAGVIKPLEPALPITVVVVKS